APGRRSGPEEYRRAAAGTGRPVAGRRERSADAHVRVPDVVDARLARGVVLGAAHDLDLRGRHLEGLAAGRGAVAGLVVDDAGGVELGEVVVERLHAVEARLLEHVVELGRALLVAYQVLHAQGPLEDLGGRDATAADPWEQALRDDPHQRLREEDP